MTTFINKRTFRNEYGCKDVSEVGLNTYHITYAVSKREKMLEAMKDLKSYGTVTEIFLNNLWGFEFVPKA